MGGSLPAASVGMRFLIVAQSHEMHELLVHLARASWPAARFEHRQFGEREAPGRGPLRGRHDAILLELPAEYEEALDWTAKVRMDRLAPPVILVALEGNDRVAARAIKAGASDYLPRRDLTPERLARAVDEALQEQEARRAEAKGVDPAFQRTTPIDIRSVGKPLAGRPVTVPGYRALRQIGQGGMAQVFLAEREHDGLQLILKVLDPAVRADQMFLKRFVREYKLLAGMQDEHVARIYDQGFAGDYPFIAMEYFPGGTLAARMHEGLSSLGALRVTSQIARALDAIHARGIVHRDLKPQNILFRANGRPALVDFGLARGPIDETQLTVVGQMVGTPLYASPEQCLGEEVDHRSDLYSLGVIFYEMLTGQRVFDAPGPGEIVSMHVHQSPPRLPQRLAGYQPILDRLLAKKPAERFQSARELFARIAV
jgi:tRNA A-37 threonylcarbamoyl transferase component Bud32/DNA-binding NarL/FixJ family response regulator